MDQFDFLTETLKLIKARKSGDQPWLTYRDAEALEFALALERDEPDNPAALLDWIERYLACSVQTDSERFVNRMWAGANTPSIAGELVAAAMQSSACTYESAPAAVRIEKYMLDQMLQLVGFENGNGQMTTGSSNANMIAMLAARNILIPGSKHAGIDHAAGAVAVVNSDAHYSLDKAANVIGLGTDNLKKIQPDRNGSMDLDHLATILRQIKTEGRSVFFVCATAGTTVRGAFDPIENLLELREEYEFWLHVDGAWGGSALFDEALRTRFFKGIEHVNSFCWDFHKMLGSNLMCNLLLMNGKRDALDAACGCGDSSYLFREEEQHGLDDPGTTSLQCGRKVDALKWFLDWKYHGREGYARRVRQSHEMACHMADRVIAHPDLELVVPLQSFNVCFRYTGDGAHPDLDQLNQSIRSELYRTAQYLVGTAIIDGRLILRWLSANPAVRKEQIDAFIESVVATGHKLARG